MIDWLDFKCFCVAPGGVWYYWTTTENHVWSINHVVDVHEWPV